MKPVLFIDLDRTLFDSDAFFNYVKDELLRSFHVSNELLQANTHLLSVGTVNHLRHSDFDTLLENLKVDKAEFLNYIQNHAEPDSFILPDAIDFINWAKQQDKFEVQVLSFGQHDFQDVKLRISPSLVKFPKNIIMTRKNDFVASYYQHREGILVDDKPDQMLPIGWIEVYVDRKVVSHEAPRRLSESVIRITTLDDAPKIISSVSF